MTDNPRELSRADFRRALSRRDRERMVRGDFRNGGDVRALRNFTGLSQVRFAEALGISVHTLRNWEQDRRTPEGPALALLRVVARHPRVVHENLAASA
jgi:putative transcriptional regulator